MLVGILVAGALLRVGWAVAAPQEPEWDPVPSDPGWYLFLGEMVSSGEGYSYYVPEVDEAQATGYYPPGYPLVLGGLIWATDLLPVDVSELSAAVALNVVLSVAMIGLVFELGRRLVNVRGGLAAAAVVALWPNLIFHSGVVLTETLTLFLLLTMLLVTLASPAVARSPGVWRLLTIGALFGLVALVRPTSVVLGPLFLLFWLLNGNRSDLKRTAATALKRTAVVAAATLVVILPWTVRNWVQLGEPVLISTNTGDNLCIGYNPDATGAYGDPGGYCLGGLDVHDPAGESRAEFDLRRQSETLDRAREGLRDNPQQIFTLMPDRLRYTIWDDADGLDAANDYDRQPLFSSGVRGLLQGSANIFYVGVMAAGIVGGVLLAASWRAGRRDDQAGRCWFLAAAGAVQLVPPLITFGDPRFKLPIYPTVAVFAAVTIVVLLGRLAGRGDGLDPDEEVAGGSAPGDHARQDEPLDLLPAGSGD